MILLNIKRYVKKALITGVHNYKRKCVKHENLYKQYIFHKDLRPLYALSYYVSACSNFFYLNWHENCIYNGCERKVQGGYESECFSVCCNAIECVHIIDTCNCCKQPLIYKNVNAIQN